MPFFGYQNAAFGGNNNIRPYAVAVVNMTPYTEYTPETSSGQADNYFNTDVMTGTVSNRELCRVAIDCDANLTTAYNFGYGVGKANNGSSAATATISIEVNGVEEQTHSSSGHMLMGNSAYIQGTGTGTKTAIMLADTTGGHGSEIYAVSMTGVAVLGPTGEGAGANQFPKIVDSAMAHGPSGYTNTQEPDTSYYYQMEVASGDGVTTIMDSNAFASFGSQPNLAIAQSVFYIRDESGSGTATISVWCGGEQMATSSSSASPWFGTLEGSITWTENGELPTMGYANQYPIFETKLSTDSGTKGCYSRNTYCSFNKS